MLFISNHTSNPNYRLTSFLFCNVEAAYEKSLVSITVHEWQGNENAREVFVREGKRNLRRGGKVTYAEAQRLAPESKRSKTVKTRSASNCTSLEFNKLNKNPPFQVFTNLFQYYLVWWSSVWLPLCILKCFLVCTSFSSKVKNQFCLFTTSLEHKVVQKNPGGTTVLYARSTSSKISISTIRQLLACNFPLFYHCDQLLGSYFVMVFTKLQ